MKNDRLLLRFETKRAEPEGTWPVRLSHLLVYDFGSGVEFLLLIEDEGDLLARVEISCVNAGFDQAVLERQKVEVTVPVWGDLQELFGNIDFTLSPDYFKGRIVDPRKSPPPGPLEERELEAQVAISLGREPKRSAAVSEEQLQEVRRRERSA